MKINIVRQDFLKFKRVQRVKQINAIVSVGSLSLFGLSVLWTTGQFLYLNYQTNNLNKKVETLSALYEARSKSVAQYVSVKQIITTASQIQSKRFKYKDFLNAIYKILPPKSKLTTVDFGQTGVVVFGVRMSSLVDYDSLLANIYSGGTDKNFLFSAVSQKSLQRDTSGIYLVTLELKIK